MFTTDVLTGKKVTLKMCGTKYATEEYVNWLNDPQVNRFLWVRYERQTLEKITDYINEIRESEDKIIFAMIESSQNKHIGNIQLTFNKIHKYCNFGYFIGDKNFWGQEIAVEAIHLAIKWAFETTDTVRINGSLYSRNVFSLKTLLKAGNEVYPCIHFVNYRKPVKRKQAEKKSVWQYWEIVQHSFFPRPLRGMADCQD